MKRAHFENGNAITTIAPTPRGESLKADGWRFIIRNGDGEEIEARDADGERARILRSFGRRV